LQYVYIVHCGPPLYGVPHTTQIKPFFEKQLMLPKHNPGSAIADGHTHLTTPVLPVYISGVLAVFDKAS